MKLKGKIMKVAKILMVCVQCLVIWSSTCWGISIDELSARIEENRINVNTGKIKFIQISPQLGDNVRKVPIGNTTVEIKKMDRYSDNTVYFDSARNIKRIEEVDLTSEELKSENKSHLDITNTQIFQDDLLLNYSPISKAILMDHKRNPSEENYTLNHIRYGYVKNSWLTLSEADKVNISESTENGQDILVVESSVTTDAVTKKRIVKIAPEFAYRFISVNEFKNDDLVWEAKCEEYKKYNDHYLPEKYSNKRLMNGQVIKEIEIILKDAEFNIEFDKDLASIEVPEGTMIAGRSLNPEIPLNTWYTKEKRILTFEDIYSHDIDILSDQAIHEMQCNVEHKTANKTIPQRNVDSNSVKVFLPLMSHAKKENKPFVFDLDGAEFVDVKFENSDIYGGSVKHSGDIAWDGNLLLLMGTEVDNYSEKMPFEYLKKEKYSVCQWQKDFIFPYEFIIKTNEGQKFKFKINQIRDDGIKAEYQKI